MSKRVNDRMRTVPVHTSPMKNTKTVDTPPTPSLSTDTRYDTDKKWCTRKSGSEMENIVSNSRYASENCILMNERARRTSESLGARECQ